MGEGQEAQVQAWEEGLWAFGPFRPGPVWSGV